MSKPVVLFLCTGNSCRSQMAEGWTRHLLADRFHACSAGVEKHGLNPRAVQVMSEAGVDISQQQSQLVGDYVDLHIDLVVTVCDHAAEACPVFPRRTKRLHHSFPDPARARGSETEILRQFRQTRDEIKKFVEELPQRFEELSGHS